MLDTGQVGRRLGARNGLNVGILNMKISKLGGL